MGTFYGNISGGRDINIESNVGSNVGDNNSIQNNITKITHTIETIQQETEDFQVKETLEELKKAIEKKHEPSIMECITKLGSSAATLGKVVFGLVKVFL